MILVHRGRGSLRISWQLSWSEQGVLIFARWNFWDEIRIRKNRERLFIFAPVHHSGRISGNFPSVNCNRCVDSVCSGKLISEEINWLSTQSNIRYMNSTRIRRRFTVSIFVTYLTFQKKLEISQTTEYECRRGGSVGSSVGVDRIAISGFSRYYTSYE